jgi:predicted ATPase
MSDVEQVFVVQEGEGEQKAKKLPKKAEQATGVLDETQQRAMAAYAAYIEAERQLEEAYKDQEKRAEKDYEKAIEQARKACEESIAQGRRIYEESIDRALRTRDEAERKAREAHNESVQQTWAVFIKARK